MKLKLTALFLTLLLVLPLAACEEIFTTSLMELDAIQNPPPGYDEEEYNATLSELFRFELLEDGTYCISEKGNVYYEGQLVLPSVYNGVKVTKIAENGFDSQGFIHVTLPPTITEIGSYAFCYSKLESIELSEGLRVIGVGAFSYCTSLTEIELPHSLVTVGLRAFDNTAVRNISVGNGIRNYDATMNDINAELTYNEYENGYYLGNALNKYALFVSPINKDYSKITLHPMTIAIAKDAFKGCRYINEVELNPLLASIGKNAFNGCTQIEEIKIPASVEIIGSGAFGGCTGISDLALPVGVKEIGSNAFANMTSLEEITLSDKLDKIDYSLFNGDTSLRSVRIGKNVKSIGSAAFSECTSLEQIVIPDSVTEIQFDAFNGCTKLSKVTLGSGVKVIGDRAFKDTASLTTITLPEGIEEIGEYAFQYSKIASINFPASMKRIGKYAFCYINLVEAHFDKHDGWHVVERYNVGLDFKEEKISDPYIAAEYISKKYTDYAWERLSFE